MLKINRILSVFALITTISCTDLTFYRETGVQPEFTGENAEQTVSLRTKQYQDNVVKLTLTSQYGITSAELDLLLRSSRPAEKRLSADLTIDESLLREYEEMEGIGTGKLQLLSSVYYTFKDGTYMSMQKGSLESNSCRLEIYATNELGQSLSAGRYLLPVSVNSQPQEFSESAVFIDLTVPEPYTDRMEPDSIEEGICSRSSI